MLAMILLKRVINIMQIIWTIELPLNILGDKFGKCGFSYSIKCVCSRCFPGRILPLGTDVVN